MPSSPTVSHLYADLILGGDGALERFVRSRRRDGLSWRLVERDLFQQTSGAVDLTFETLRSWFPDEAAS
jgi:hypothetical protein